MWILPNPDGVRLAASSAVPPGCSCSPGGALLASTTGAAWTVAGRPPSALFKVLVLGDNGVGKTALARALCGKGFQAEYTPGTAVSVSARSFSREGHPPAVLEVQQ